MNNIPRAQAALREHGLMIHHVLYELAPDLIYEGMGPMCPVGYGSIRGYQYLEAHGSYFLSVMMAAMRKVNTYT